MPSPEKKTPKSASKPRAKKEPKPTVEKPEKPKKEAKPKTPKAEKPKKEATPKTPKAEKPKKETKSKAQTPKQEPKSCEKSPKEEVKSPKEEPESAEKSPKKMSKPDDKTPAKDSGAQKTLLASTSDSADDKDYSEVVKRGRYDPIEDAMWKRGVKTPYLAFAKTLQAIEATSGRLKTIEILANYFRFGQFFLVTISSLKQNFYLLNICDAQHLLDV